MEMDNEIWAAIIPTIVVFITLLYNMYRNHQQFKKAEENSIYKSYYDQVKERRDKKQMKIDQFYEPLKCYLAQSKMNYTLLVDNKPKDFRTLEYLLDRTKKFNGEEVIWTANDDILLKNIFEYGKLMEDLILGKRGIIDDAEFVDVYQPSPGFDDMEYPEGMSLLDIAVAHFSFIRSAQNDLGKDHRFKKYVYPRELNRRITSKLGELKKEIDENEKLLVKYMNRIGGSKE